MVILGDHDLANLDPLETTFFIENIIVHPGYNRGQSQMRFITRRKPYFVGGNLPNIAFIPDPEYCISSPGKSIIFS